MSLVIDTGGDDKSRATNQDFSNMELHSPAYVDTGNIEIDKNDRFKYHMTSRGKLVPDGTPMMNSRKNSFSNKSTRGDSHDIQFENISIPSLDESDHSGVEMIHTSNHSIKSSSKKFRKEKVQNPNLFSNIMDFYYQLHADYDKPIAAFMDSLVIGLCMTIFTIVALFLTDLNDIYGTRDTDEIVNMVMFVLFIIFGIELVLESFCRHQYFMQNMFFYLDLLALLTMIQYVPGAVVAFGLPRSALTARAGRVGRIVRIVRIVRLTRIGKLAKYPRKIYRYFHDPPRPDPNLVPNTSAKYIKGEKVEVEDDLDADSEYEPEEEEEGDDESAGTLLSEMTAISVSKIIAGIVVMLLALNYVGNVAEPYTPIIAMDNKIHTIQSYFGYIDQTASIDAISYQMSILEDMCVDLINSDSNDDGDNTYIVYYFAYANITKLVASNYTELEYVVLRDHTDASIVQDKQVRIGLHEDVEHLVIPESTTIPWNSSWSYDHSDSSSVYTGSEDIPGLYDDFLTPLVDQSVSTVVNADNQVNFLIKLNLRGVHLDEFRGSIDVSCFMIGLILLWYIIYNLQASELSSRICKPLELMMSDMVETSQLKFDNLRFIHLDKSNDDSTSCTDVDTGSCEGDELQAVDKSPISIEETSLKEVKLISKSFYSMASGLMAFAKYVPRDIVLEMLRGGNTGLGVHPKEITIFFSDIEGFTTLCDVMPPNDVLFMLSDYFKAMNTIISRTGGTLIEFIGDAILATWNAPGDVTDHAAACVEASLQMHEYLHALTYSSAWKEKGYPIIKIRCGIHTANVFVGNLGAPDRMKYGIMGDGVNLASRLEELNKKYSTRILISESTFHQGDEDEERDRYTKDADDRFRIQDNYITRQLDTVQVKGRTSGTSIYEVLGRKMPTVRPIKIYHPDEAEPSIGDQWRDRVQAQHLENFNMLRAQNHKISMKLNTAGNSNEPEASPSEINSLRIRLADCYNNGMKLYFDRQFIQAIEEFEAVLLLRQEMFELQQQTDEFRKLNVSMTCNRQIWKSLVMVKSFESESSFNSVHGDSKAGESPKPSNATPEGAIDVPAKLLIKRCHQYIKTPPAEDWNGVEVLTTKEG